MNHDVRDFERNLSESALYYPQEQFENAAQEHQRVAYEQAALASSRAAAQMTSRFRVIENNDEAHFSHGQRGPLSEITSKSAEVLEAQRHYLCQEATAEMIRRDNHNQEVVSQ